MQLLALVVHEYDTKAKEVARVRARMTFTKAITLLNMSTVVELLHGCFSLRNGLSSSSLPSMGANSYEPREGISPHGLVEEIRMSVSCFFGRRLPASGKGILVMLTLAWEKLQRQKSRRHLLFPIRPLCIQQSDNDSESIFRAIDSLGPRSVRASPYKRSSS